MDRMNLATRKVVRSGFRIILVLAALAPLGYTLYKEWPQLQTSLQEIVWGKFIVAQLILLPVMVSVGLVPWASLRHIGSHFSYSKATAIYFFTQIFKYLPGGIWAFPGRVAIYQLLGLGSAQSVVSVFRETAAMFLGAAFVGLTGLVQGLSLSEGLRLAIGLGVAACAGGILLLQIPWVWKMISSFKLFSRSPLSAYSDVTSRHRNIAWLPWTFLGSVCFWFFFGLPFQQLAIAIHPQATSLSWFEASAIFALAWCAGFVVVFVPAGFGVRESALAFLLVNIMPVGAALSLALLARVTWIVAEGFWILVTMVWVSRSPELSWEAIWGMRE